MEKVHATIFWDFLLRCDSSILNNLPPMDSNHDKVIQSHIASDAIEDPKDLKGLAETVAKEIKQPPQPALRKDRLPAGRRLP